MIMPVEVNPVLYTPEHQNSAPMIALTNDRFDPVVIANNFILAVNQANPEDAVTTLIDRDNSSFTHAPETAKAIFENIPADTWQIFFEQGQQLSLWDQSLILRFLKAASIEGSSNAENLIKQAFEQMVLPPDYQHLIGMLNAEEIATLVLKRSQSGDVDIAIRLLLSLGYGQIETVLSQLPDQDLAYIQQKSRETFAPSNKDLNGLSLHGINHLYKVSSDSSEKFIN